jgi:hypothetical protein
MLQELLSAWKPYETLKLPASHAINLWGHDSRAIVIDKSWGPAVPYPASDHGDGTLNYGYIRLKGHLELIDQVPEVRGWPELRDFLQAVNADGSPIESLGCEKSYFAVQAGEATIMLGSYIDVAFTDVSLNDDAKNHLRLAATLAESIAGCEQWWASVHFCLQRLRHLAGADTRIGLMLHVANYGKSEERSRKYWGETLRRLGNVISKLPQDFPRSS